MRFKPIVKTTERKRYLDKLTLLEQIEYLEKFQSLFELRYKFWIFSSDSIKEYPELEGFKFDDQGHSNDIYHTITNELERANNKYNRENSKSLKQEKDFSRKTEQTIELIKWKGTTEQLHRLIELLIDREFLNDCDIDSLIASHFVVESKIPSDSRTVIEGKIRWRVEEKKTHRQLIYLVIQLGKNEFLNIPDIESWLYRDEWTDIISQHFCHFDYSTCSHKYYTSKYLTDQFGQMKEGKPKVKHAKEIDDLLSKIT